MIVVLSQGCAANFGDGEKIARALSAHHEVSFSIGAEKPEAFYLNVCTVKGNAGALKLLRTVHTDYPNVPVFITGCAPKDFRDEALKIDPQVAFTSLSEIAQDEAQTIGVLRESPYVGIVNIEEGCLDACAFCSTHLVKGRLHSANPDYIVEQVQALVNDGCKEIQITGQDCACYGFDIGTNLALLTQKILVKVPGDYRIRLGMGNPRHVLQYTEPLLECFTDERIYKFLHIPVQSGSNSVLKAMNRKHTAEDYLSLAQMLNSRFSRFTLSTDLIVGHPGETEEDFCATLDLLKTTRPTVCNITRFVARPGTVSARMEEGITPGFIAVSDSEKHDRSAKLFEEFQKIAQENNQQWVGDSCKVVIEKEGHRTGTTIARNDAYRPVALQGTYPAGKSLRVRITGAEPFALLAEPI